MFLVTQFSWPAVRDFHAAVLFKIECNGMESRLLRHTPKSLSNASSSSFPLSGAVLFWRDFKPGNERTRRIIMALYETKGNGYSTFAPDVGICRALLRGIPSFLQSVPDLRLLRVRL